ncbi:unnamed protein product [Owenia fusiformis]|uniref:Uncharacterized protein n=1 Tax=Owenia fusiformis TaxID=6347 RepID=A0A8J1UVK7_OWEFU|nr:unnamed protein product [Owenia fusiformis]
MSERQLSILKGEENDNAGDFIHKVFENTVKGTIETSNGMKPIENQMAVRFGEETLTFGRLNKRANMVARIVLKRMVDNGIEVLNSPDKTISVFMEPSARRVIALISILKLGGAYVPMSSVFPPKRLQYILDEGKPICIFACGSNANNPTIQAVPVFNIDSILDEIEADSCTTVEDTNLTDADFAPMKDGLTGENPLICTLFTSGSTGTPKGVKLTHDSQLNIVNYYWDKTPFKQDETGCALLDLLFVDSIREMYTWLLKGRPLIILPQAVKQDPEMLIKAIEQYNITRLACVPVLLRNMLVCLNMHSIKNRLSHLKFIILGGEVVPSVLVRDFFSYFSDGHTLINGYGCTETAGDTTIDIFSSLEDAEKKTNDHIMSIGVPIYNTNVYIVDEKLEPVPMGEIGEVLCSGVCLSTGYTDTSRMNVFVKNTVLPSQGHELLFRVGDFGKIVDGRIFYQGRRDFQVKIRGYRVNVSELESVMQSHPGVDQATTIVHNSVSGMITLVAFYTAIEEKEASVESVTEFCSQYLPTYMMPHFEKIDKFPIQAIAGKIDRMALKAMYENKFNETVVESNTILHQYKQDEFGMKVLESVAKVIEIPVTKLIITKDFFQNGGTSANAMYTIADMKSKGVLLTVADFLGSSSLHDLIETLRQKKDNNVPASVIDTDTYELVNICTNSNYKDQAMVVLSDAFIRKDLLIIDVGCTFEQYMHHLKTFWPILEQDNISMGVVNRVTGKVVAAGMLLSSELDYEVAVEPELLYPIAALVMQAEEPARKAIAELGGKWLWSGSVATAKYVSDAENIRLIHMLEVETMRVARSLGYTGLITVNTHPVTIALAELEFGWKTIVRVPAKNFEYEGKAYFTKVEDDFVVAAQIKPLN